MMCGETLPEEKQCLKETISTIIKSIEVGEKKLRKIFKERNNESNKGPNK